MSTFRFQTSDLDGLYLFSQGFERAIGSVRSDRIECQLDHFSGDCFAPRFNGYRVYARNPMCGRNMYLWCGLLYDPSSRMGLMIEMDAFSNQDVYKDAFEGIKPDDAYEIEKNEKHIKLFMPQAHWDDLCSLPSAEEQIAALAAYAAACMEAFSRAIDR